MTAPLTGIIEALRVTSVSFRGDWGQEQSGLGDGSLVTKDLRPMLWSAVFEAAQLTHAQADQVQADIESMGQSIDTFYAWNPRRWYPQSDFQGALLGSSTVQIHTVGGDNKSLRLKGLPAGYVLTKGDLLSFDYGSSPTRRALHRVARTETNTVVADGSGVTPLFPVTTNIRAGAAEDAVVALVKPGPEMKIVPGTIEDMTTGQIFSSLRFEAIQVL